MVMKPSLLVVCPEGRVAKWGSFKNLCFVSDTYDWSRDIAGMHLQGIIVEPGARVSEGNMRFFLTRLRPEHEPFFNLDLYSESVLMGVLEDEYRRQLALAEANRHHVVDQWIKEVCDAAKIPYPWD